MGDYATQREGDRRRPPPVAPRQPRVGFERLRWVTAEFVRQPHVPRDRQALESIASRFSAFSRTYHRICGASVTPKPGILVRQREEPEGRRGDREECGAPHLPLDRRAASRLAMTAQDLTDPGSNTRLGRYCRGNSNARFRRSLGRLSQARVGFRPFQGLTTEFVGQRASATLKIVVLLASGLVSGSKAARLERRSIGPGGANLDRPPRRPLCGLLQARPLCKMSHARPSRKLRQGERQAPRGGAIGERVVRVEYVSYRHSEPRSIFRLSIYK